MKRSDPSPVPRGRRKAVSAEARRKSFGAHFRDFTGLGRSAEDNALFLLIVCMFVHWTLSILATLSVAVYVLTSKKRITAALSAADARWILASFGFFVLISLVRKNFLSVGLLFGIALYVTAALWVRSFLTRRRVSRLLDLSVASSFFSAALAFVQKFILHASEWDYLVVGNTSNANYYGLQISFVILTALYCLFRTRFRKNVFFYLSAVFVNFAAFVFTESVASLFGLIAGILLLLFAYRHYKTFAASLFGLSAVFVGGLALPSDPWNGSLLYPILERVELWKISWHSCTQNAANFLFGQGLYRFQSLWDAAPRSFWDVRGVTPRDFQPHSHNLYLEILLSLGLIGAILFCVFFIRKFVQVVRKSRLQSFRHYGIFFCVIALCAFVSNLADASLFWVQDGFWFLLCCAATSVPVPPDPPR